MHTSAEIGEPAIGSSVTAVARITSGRWGDPREAVPRTCWVRCWLAIAVAACGSGQPFSTVSHDGAPAGHTADGRDVRVTIADERIAALASDTATTWLWSPIIDSHVHLAYWPVADQLTAAGVAAVVDLAAPERSLGAPRPLHVIASGPMLTQPYGYPVDAWGSNGFGAGCGDAACVTQTIDRLVAHGAQVIKLALDSDGLAPSLVPIAVQVARDHHVKVAVHALSDDAANRAAAAGADMLAHTPTEPLADATIAAWHGRAVISTLAAFGSEVAVENLRKLRAAGATVLYGTDLGNLRTPGPSAEEIDLLRKAGLDDAAITAAMTTTPATYWKLFGPVAVGAEASLLVLDRDPREDVRTLLAPREAWLRGRRVR